MATSLAYKTYILELLEPSPGISSRNMFGGVGIYAEGLMCALISSDDVLYFKVDDHNRADYEAAASEQFHNMPYYAVPAEIIEDNEAIRQWFSRSIKAAHRIALAKKTKASSS